jgi:hypothetical protein
MSDSDLRNLYENVRRGVEYHAPRRESELYNDIFLEKRIEATNNGDEACGNTETSIKYRDPDTKQWRCARASDKWIEDILKPALGIADSASYLNRILEHGKVTGVFDDSMNIGHPSVLAFYDWLNKSVSRGTLAQVINQLPSVKIQDTIINAFENPRTGIFNFYSLLNDTINSEVPGASANFKEDPKLTIIRPASDTGATRGAAGPGEALLAFMYNGSKPTVGDLVFNEIDRKGNQTNKVRYVVELKKTGGRIGKGIRKKDVRELQALFHGLNAAGAQFDKAGALKKRGLAGSLRGISWNNETDPNSGFTLEEKFIKEWENKSMYDFLVRYSGIQHSSVDELDKQVFTQGIYANCVAWFQTNAGTSGRGLSGGSVYSQIIQWIGGIHIKDYFKQVADFNTIAVFLQDGTIAGFPRTAILSRDAIEISKLLDTKNCYFGPKPDEGGFDIQIKGVAPQE